jgi:hypothetical protein
MKRALCAVVCAGLVACEGSRPPAPPPVAAEIAFVSGAGGLRLVEVRDGTQLAQLPEGAFDANLTPGGDLGEAYLVAAAGVMRVHMGRPVRVDRVADAVGAGPFSAALVPAPQLSTFVGDKTVLVTLSADGRLAGYQSGTRLWSRAAAGGTELHRVGDMAALRAPSGWLRVIPETGDLEALAACAGGPVGGTFAQPVYACELHPSPPAGLPFDLRPPAGDEVLVWPSGAFYRIHDGVSTPGAKGAGGGRPAVSADGKRLYWPHDYANAIALASSRDGNYLYVLGAGRLRVLAPAGARELTGFPVEGTDIPLIAGG